MNTLLLKTGLIEQPLNLLYTEFALSVQCIYFTNNDYDLSWGYGKHLLAETRRQSNDGFRFYLYQFQAPL